MALMKLYGEPGWGSAIVEAQLEWYGLPYEFEPVGNIFKSAEARQQLSEVNPIAQVPTLVLDDGTVMTESAAITLLLAETSRDDSLVPPPGSIERAAFLRWLAFIVANVYPTFTYADDPPRFVEAEDAREGFRNAVDAYAMRMYRVMEDYAGEPWFLGERFSALDIYLCTLTRWRPSRDWFAENTPKLSASATATDAIEKLQPTWQRNFPD
jgi:GST-like protein